MDVQCINIGTDVSMDVQCIIINVGTDVSMDAQCIIVNIGIDVSMDAQCIIINIGTDVSMDAQCTIINVGTDVSQCVIIINHFSIALFSALQQTHCTLAACDSEWWILCCEVMYMSIIFAFT